jgi:hypothetical protein
VDGIERRVIVSEYVLFGYGGNGKSVFTGVLTSLHGAQNVSNVPLRAMINNTFVLSDLEGRVLISIPVVPREDNISISTEQTLDRATSDRVKILQHLNQLVDEVYEGVRKHGYEFRTVGVKLVRSDFSIETRERSFLNSRDDRESIASVLQGLVDRFSFFNNNNTTTINYRKVGIKISNLSRVKNKKKLALQTTLLDYI